MSDPAAEAAAATAAAALKTRLDAETAARNTAAIERTTFRFRQPTSAELAVQQRAQAAAADKTARAVLRRPSNSESIAQFQQCNRDQDRHARHAPKAIGLLHTLAANVAEFGAAAFDGPEEEVSQTLNTVAKNGMYWYCGLVQAVLAAGALIKALSDRNMLEQQDVILDACKSALQLHAADVRVHKLFRDVLLHCGHRCLDPIAKVLLERDLQTALILMTPWAQNAQEDHGQQALLTIRQDVLQCLEALLNRATFVLMCDDEHDEFKTLVAVFATWCLHGCLRESTACFFGDLNVGRKAGCLLYQMAAGCMQNDSEYLEEEERQMLCRHDVPKLLFELRQRMPAASTSRVAGRIEWLLQRMGRDPLHRALSRNTAPMRPLPSAAERAPAAQRRGEGGSA